MSEFWVSRKKWTCKYCDVTINDDVPSRQQHENGLRHKGNVERSLRQAYKKSERDRNDERDAKREMEKIERLAQQSHAKDLASAGLNPSSSSSSSLEPSKPAKEESKGKKEETKTAWKPTNRLDAYGSALPFNNEGTTAEDEERVLREWQERQEARKREGTAGEWQTVAPSAPSTVTAAESVRPERDNERAYKVREKQGQFREHDDEDEGMEIRVKKRRKAHGEADKAREAEEETRRMMPTWKPMRLDTGIGVKEEGVQAVEVQRSEGEEAVDLDEEAGKASSVPPPGAQTASQGEGDSASSSLFKKRKSGAGAGAKRVRAVI